MDLRFVSCNQFKIEEVKAILEGTDINIVPFQFKLEELQIEDTEKLVKDKLLKAFRKVGRPLFVEHTGLYIESLNGFPGGLTQIFWDKIEAERFSSIFGSIENSAVKAKTTIGYCDGMKLHYFEGITTGVISKQPQGDSKFQWDCIFIPEGYGETFSQMGDEKNKISMRKIAFDKFVSYLKEKK